MNACNRNRMHIKGDYISWNRAVITSFMDAGRAKYMGVAVNGVSRLFMFYLHLHLWCWCYHKWNVSSQLSVRDYCVRQNSAWIYIYNLSRIWYWHQDLVFITVRKRSSVLVSGLSVHPPHVKFPCIFRRPDYETSNVVDTVIMRLSSLEELCSLNFCYFQTGGGAISAHLNTNRWSNSVGERSVGFPEPDFSNAQLNYRPFLTSDLSNMPCRFADSPLIGLT